MKNTKIVATIGPASADKNILKEMIKSGMNVARLNFSHGTFSTHLNSINTIRQVSKKLNTKVTIFQDLCGPKLRLGEFEEKHVTEGKKVILGAAGLPVQKEIWKWVKKGQVILIDDGAVELVVTKATNKGLEAKVVVGGVIKSRKGVSLPGVKVDLPSLSEKDLADLEFGLNHNIDAVALSFVKTPLDIVELREKIAEQTDRKVKIIAKIETIEALENIKSIIQTSDAIMVARGDLALNVDQNQVPLYQKHIIRLCKQFNKPVIVATQMLESMIANPRPTRAEVSDVANAVLDGADAVMLSGETAFGKYPVIVIKTMADIIEQTENSEIYKSESRQSMTVAA